MWEIIDIPKSSMLHFRVVYHFPHPAKQSPSILKLCPDKVSSLMTKRSNFSIQCWSNRNNGIDSYQWMGKGRLKHWSSALSWWQSFLSPISICQILRLEWAEAGTCLTRDKDIRLSVESTFRWVAGQSKSPFPLLWRFYLTLWFHILIKVSRHYEALSPQHYCSNSAVSVQHQ